MVPSEASMSYISAQTVLNEQRRHVTVERDQLVMVGNKHTHAATGRVLQRGRSLDRSILSLIHCILRHGEEAPAHLDLLNAQPEQLLMLQQQRP